MTDQSVFQSSQHGYALLERRRQIVTDAAKGLNTHSQHKNGTASPSQGHAFTGKESCPFN